MATKAKEIFNDLNLVLRLNQHIEELTASEASAAALLNKETSFKVLAELTSIENPDPREDAQFDHQRPGFREATDASKLPFHLQGDQAFNEASALARRRQLRHCEAVKSKIHFLWQVARGRKTAELTHQQSSERLRTLSGAVRPPTAAQFRTPYVSTINETEYTEMMLLIFKVLRDDFVLATAQRQIQCDWEVDSHHGDALSYDQFFPALFELVDVWTCDILEATYVRFLELLTRRITVRVVVYLDDMKLKLALSDNFDEAVVVKAIPLSTIKQFASVAKVMEGTGVRTVGDLARTDPQVVESQRVGYLEKNTFSKAKIGDELKHLLDMFREISEQFQDANYSLQNKRLQRVPWTERDGAVGDHHEGRDGSFGRSYAVQPSPFTQGNRGAGLQYSGDDSDERASSDGARFGKGSIGRSDSLDAEGGEPPGQIHPGRDSSGSGRSGEYSARGTLNDSPNGTTDAILKRGGIKRINTFHDISVTETGVIDALKATFLIEKGISILRKTTMPSIRAELEKFGVDTKAMGDAAMQSKYDSLYETFVLRDGDNIKALAQSILARIKMELAAHGIEVNDAEVEAMYDGFYGSVVAGSGGRIVADAQNWVDDTVRSNSYGAYIKQDYHELKSIDEVKLLGSSPEDAEFVSLLSTEDDDEEADDEDGDTIGDGSESLTTKATNSLSRRPSLYRGMSEKFKTDRDSTERLSGGKSVPSLPSAETDYSNQEGDPTSASSLLSPGHFTREQKLDSRADAILAGLHSADSSQDDTDGPRSSRGDETAEFDKVSCEGVPGDGTASSHANEFSGEAVATEESQSEPGEKRISTPEISRSDQVHGGASTGVDSDDDEARRKRSLGQFKPTHSKSDLLNDAQDNAGGNHSHQHESDREPQGVGYEYEDTQQEAVVEVRSPTPESPISHEPKVPDIVVGGVDSGNGVAVAARYIQLLGLGNVSSIRPESDLLAHLGSPAGRSIDLVCFDVGEELDNALEKARELISLVGRKVILLGGDERQPEKSSVISRLCVSEGGALFFATVPIDFPALRGAIVAFFDASPQQFIMRQRRPTAVFGAAAKLLSTSVRATNMISVEDDHPRSVLTPPLSMDNSSAKRKATATPTVSSPLPLLPTPKRENFSPFRALRAIDEMPGADVALTTRFSPVVPSSHASKPNRKSPRLSAALKKFMR